MTIREGKALKFLYVPDSYAGGIQEGDETPVFIDGVDPAGSAAAVAADLATHESLTGTAVHGLGSASTLTAGTAGAAVVEAETVDGARDALGLAAVALPPRYVDHAIVQMTSENVVGSAVALSTQNTAIRLATGGTPNSQMRRVSAGGRIGNVHSFVNWSERNIFRFVPNAEIANVEGIYYGFYGKNSSAFGAVSAGDYVGFKLENTSIVELYVCASGTLQSIPVSEFANNLPFSIVAENGNVIFYKNGIAISASVLGPTNPSAVGFLSFEIANGVTSAGYNLALISYSEAY